MNRKNALSKRPARDDTDRNGHSPPTPPSVRKKYFLMNATDGTKNDPLASDAPATMATTAST
ncbi:MAG: hypothetical protein IT410_02975 [Candidatus Doudnabacteria bacterium]|nr:hypothetical protein [Candidatus Doudnabacteria bacterium]